MAGFVDNRFVISYQADSTELAKADEQSLSAQLQISICIRLYP